MPESRGKFAEPWPPLTTCHEVMLFAAQRVPEFLLLFDAAYRKRDNAHMIENIKLLRGVVTRLDAFRRMKVREWAEAEKLVTKTELKTE